MAVRTVTGAGPTGSVDPTTAGYFEDPYGQFAEARALAPVQEHPNGTWMVFRHGDVDHTLHATRS